MRLVRKVTLVVLSIFALASLAFRLFYPGTINIKLPGAITFGEHVNRIERANGEFGSERNAPANADPKTLIYIPGIKLHHATLHIFYPVPWSPTANGRELKLLWVYHGRNPQAGMGLVRISVSLLVAILAAYPAWAARAYYRGPYRRKVRRKKGLCIGCGYNLTGNESGVCPECGEAIRPSAGA